MGSELSINPDENEISLEDNKSDRVVVALKGALGAVPVVGSILSEVVGVVIPNQKADRIKRFVEVFAEKVNYIEKDVLNVKLKTEKFTDLFEDALLQAARALTDERREYIANFLKNSLATEDLEHIKEKKILSILNELNDAEIICLKYESLRFEKRHEFKILHEKILFPPIDYGVKTSNDRENEILLKAYRLKLDNLGLLINWSFNEPKEDEIHKFDFETGKLKSEFKDVSELGCILLKYIDGDFVEN